MSETENKPLPYPIPQPNEVTSGERDDAMSSYLMMFASWLIGLPIPFINMLAAVVFFLVNRRKSRFVAFHAYQNMLSNIFTSLLNSFMIGWTIRAIFTEHFSKGYVAAVIAVILINIFYAVSSLIAAMRAYRGQFYYQLYFGRMAFNKYYGPNAKPLDPGPGVNAPPPGVCVFSAMRFLKSGLQEILFLASLIGVLVLGIYFLLPALEWKWDSDKLTLDLEKRFGDMLVEEIKNDPTYYNDETVSKALATMERRLTNAVTNLPFPVRILVVRNSAVNAFTFPGGVILIHTGLLAKSDSAEEVAGVLAHELGHVANRDTLKALYRQVGLSLIVAVVTGGRSDQIQDLVTQLISIKFTRAQEGLADDYAIGLLIKAGINPEYLARFFEKLKKQQSDVEKFAKFLNTHPDTEGRMKKARDAGKKFDPNKTKPLGINWTQVKKKLPSLLSQ